MVYITLTAFTARLISRAPGTVQHAFQLIERAAILLVGAFILYSGVLFLNGSLDSTPPVEVASKIEHIGGSEVEIVGFLPYAWADVKSWRTGGIERMFLTQEERSLGWPGQAVLIQLHHGYFGIPWVSAVIRDQEKYYRQVLQIAPTAAGPLKTLIQFYVDRTRWKEAAAAGHEYLTIYPDDYEFIGGVAAALGVARQNAAATALLEPFLTRQPDNYELFNLVGWGLAKSGNRAKGIRILEAAIPLDPQNWWAYYHLGYVYHDAGRLEDALAMFEKVLERRPNYPEVNQQIQSLRKIIAQREQQRKE